MNLDKEIYQKLGSNENIPTKTEMFKFLSAIDDNRDRALLSIMYHTGRRINEILSLEMTDITESNIESGEKILKIKCKISKKKKLLYITTPCKFTDSIVQLFIPFIRLKQEKKSKYLINFRTDQQADNIVKKYHPNLRTHWFRHVRASHLGTVMKESELMAYMGWSDPKMAARYVHSQPENVLKKFDEI